MLHGKAMGIETDQTEEALRGGQALREKTRKRDGRLRTFELRAKSRAASSHIFRLIKTFYIKKL
jgi:hypothetical protein